MLGGIIQPQAAVATGQDGRLLRRFGMTFAPKPGKNAVGPLPRPERQRHTSFDISDLVIIFPNTHSLSLTSEQYLVRELFRHLVVDIAVEADPSSPLKEQFGHSELVFYTCEALMVELVPVGRQKQLFAFTLAVLLGTFMPVSGGEETDPIKITKEAYLSAKSNLRSGIGSGTYETYHKDEGEKELTPVVRAKVKTYFDGDKYHIRLDYQQEKSLRLEKRIIIFDGRSIITSQFSKNIRPKGAQAALYQVQEGDAVPRQAGFVFDPSKLPDAIFELDNILKHASASLSLTKRPGGDIRASISSTRQHRASSTSCLNTVSMRLRSKR